MPPTVLNATAGTATVGWVSDPDGRGTFSLILSCLLTLGLCVWSAVHLNIPQKGEGQGEFWLRRVKWSLCGVLFPELVVLLAWRQQTSAARLTNEINKVIVDIEQKSASSNFAKRPKVPANHVSEINSQPPITKRRYPWTNVHSFYAGSGGFVFELEKSQGGYGNEPFVPGPQRLTITAHGVLLLAKCGLLPDFHEREIKDKSKQDGMAKALALLQAAWMLIQTLGRVATHIPISLLEVNTIGHILCAFIVYLLWWNKPREIQEPTVLKGEWVDSMCAYMYMSSRVSGARIKGPFKPRSWITPELKKCVYLDFSHDCTSGYSANSTPTEMVDIADFQTPPEPRIRPAATVDSSANNQLSGVFQLQPSLRLDSQKTFNRKLKMGWTPDPVLDSLALQKIRYKLAATAVQDFPAVGTRFRRVISGDETPTYDPLVEQLVVLKARNWPSDFLLPGLGGELMGMVLWFSTMAYGGVHIAAWHEYFPTKAEKQMWRFSSVYIACSGLLWLLMNVFGALSPWASVYWDRFIALKAWKTEYLVYGATATICGIVYLFARAFLVVDAIISLRRSPAETYSTPQWSQFLVHL